MASPRSLTVTVYTHWDVNENLVLRGREFPAFDVQEVSEVISCCSPQ